MNTKKEKIKVCIVESFRLSRVAFKYALSEYQNIKIQGEFETALDCLKFLEKNSTNVILTEIDLSVMDGIKAIRKIKNKYPQIKIIVLTSHKEKEYVTEAMKAGASAYAIKDIEFDELHNVICSVNRGAVWFDSKIAQAAIDVFCATTPSNNEKNKIKDKLTSREIQILKLIGDGLSNIEISKKLFISSHTVKIHVSSIFSKLSVTDRIQAAIKAYKLNII